MHDRLRRHLLGRQQRESFAQIDAQLVAEHAVAPHARAILALHTVLEHVPKEVQVLTHGESIRNKGSKGNQRNKGLCPFLPSPVILVFLLFPVFPIHLLFSSTVPSFPMSFSSEFKEFAVKGNMIDLAVGIMIGGAFQKIVHSLVNDILMPPVGLLLGKVDFSNLYVNLSDKI